jgi:RNA-binding protein
MYELPLTGAQKTCLRGLGQALSPALKVGKGGVTPAFLAELQQHLRANELVKLRFLAADRTERATLCAQIADEGRCVWVGAVGHVALFYRQNPVPAERKVELH